MRALILHRHAHRIPAGTPTPQPAAPAPAPPPGTDIYLVAARERSGVDENGEADAGVGRAGLRQSAELQPGRQSDPVCRQSRRQADRYLRVRSRRTARHAADADRRERKLSDLSCPRAPVQPAVSPSSNRSSIKRATGRSRPIQRLWRFNAEGKSPQLILATSIPWAITPGWTPINWCCSSSVARASRPRCRSRASRPARRRSSPRALADRCIAFPERALASFVQREASGEFWVKQIDITTKKIDPLVKAVEGSSDRDMAWMPDGKTILMSTGTKVMSWTRGAAGWTEVFDGAPHQLGAITRLSVSPKGDAVAIVVAEPDRKDRRRGARRHASSSVDDQRERRTAPTPAIEPRRRERERVAAAPSRLGPSPSRARSARPDRDRARIGRPSRRPILIQHHSRLGCAVADRETSIDSARNPDR